MYRVNEIFLSLQGEGVRAGTANVFVRFTGCNLRCSRVPGPRSPGGFDCDTEFISGRTYTEATLLDAIRAEAGACRWVILTGGEPGLQIDAPLLAALRSAGFRVAIETNGTVALSATSYDWITVSPKVAEHAVAQRWAHEVKYVRAHGQGIPHTVVQAQWKLLSPVWAGDAIDPRALAWCIDLCREYPEWRLSCQQHKWWAVR